jgi:hypothetical protein
MISNVALVELFAFVGSASRNVSSATSATASMFDRSDGDISEGILFELSVQEEVSCNACKLPSCRGRLAEFRFTFGKAWT